jgi:hypothetical protein
VGDRYDSVPVYVSPGVVERKVISPDAEVWGLGGGERTDDAVTVGRVSVYEPDEPPDLDFVGEEDLDPYP